MFLVILIHRLIPSTARYNGVEQLYNYIDYLLSRISVQFAMRQLLQKIRYRTH